MLRSAALNIISALKIEGGCNCQFALNPETFEYAVIEVNPRVSRSSALASKATGYPIAKVAALIAIGYNLDEIPNFVTKKTAACFEPVLDYVVVKFPKFPFDKFVYAARKLGTQMKATGEVMAIGRTFEEALMKAVRGAEIGVTSLNLPVFEEESDEKIKERVAQCTDQRLFAVFQALKRNIMSVDEIHAVTMIDEWFLNKMMKLVSMEKTFLSVKDGKTELSADLYLEAKKNGYPDKVIEKMTGVSIPGSTGIITEAEKAAGLRAEGKLAHIPATYKMVDTCAGEFNAETPYFYGGFDAENEAASFLKDMEANKKAQFKRNDYRSWFRSYQNRSGN